MRRFLHFKSNLTPFYLGLSLLFTNLVTIRRLYFNDGSFLYGYGLPWPWLKFGNVSSGEYVFHLFNLALNLAVCFFIILVLNRILPTKNFSSNTKLKNFLNIIGLSITIFFFILMYFHWGNYTFIEALFDKTWTLKSTEIYFGIDRAWWP